jgi:pimeloyl-ACP methyl ester carboxylesterase
MEKSEKHFVLVHGAFHGAWCWYKVATFLKSAGHRVTALDLGASGIHPKQVHDIHSLSDYHQPLLDFLTVLPPEERVVLVGHSMGGASVSTAMEMSPEKISVAVFASALMAGPQLKLSEIFEEYNRRKDPDMDIQYEYGDGGDSPPTSMLFGPNLLATKFYQLSPPEDLMLAMSLVRPFCSFRDVTLIDTKPTLSKEKYGSVPRVYIVCDQDQALREDFQHWMIQNNPTVDQEIVIHGSDHMVMFSKPHELASCLQDIAQKYF